MNIIKPIPQFIKWLFSRMIFIYVLLFLLFDAIYDFDAMISHARLLILNRLKPESVEVLVAMHRDPGKVDARKLEEFIHYYEKISAYLPDRADAVSLLGYCHERLGEREAAIDYYKKATVLNPDFFWSYYNLGVLYLFEGNYEEAITTFKEAVTLEPQLTKDIIESSIRIYVPLVFSSGQSSSKRVAQQIKDGHHRSYEYLLYMYDKLGRYQDMLGVAVRAMKVDLEDDGIFYYYAGVAAFHLGNYQESMTFLKEALLREERHAQSVRYLGRNLEALGQAVSARKFLDLAERLEMDGEVLDLGILNRGLELY